MALIAFEKIHSPSPPKNTSAATAPTTCRKCTHGYSVDHEKWILPDNLVVQKPAGRQANSFLIAFAFPVSNVSDGWTVRNKRPMPTARPRQVSASVNSFRLKAGEQQADGA